MRGKLILITGLNGAGKTTQAKLLCDYLIKRGYKSKYVHFPFYNSVFGRIISSILRGKKFDILFKNEYVFAMLYALDRYLIVNTKIKPLLDQGINIVMDRYYESNLFHNASRLIDQREKFEEFIEYFLITEQKIFKIPEPIITVFLKSNPETTIEMIKTRGEADRQESEDEIYRSHLAAEPILKKFPHWKIINSHENNRLLSIEKIHKQILKIVMPIFDGIKET